MVAEFRKPALFDRHLTEWLKESRVSEEITLANVQSLANADTIKRRLNRKTWTFGAGWWVSGIDPETGDRRSWGQFKPDNPEIDKTTGKTKKYVAPYKLQYEPQFLEIPSQPHFWHDVLKDSSVEVFVTEGAKKAGAMLTHGIPTIALTGVDNGLYGQKTNPDKPLLPDLEKFAVEGRSFLIGFDSDIQVKPNVLRAMADLAERLTAKGCSVRTFEWSAVQ